MRTLFNRGNRTDIGALMINIQQFDHIGIRITERRRSVLFYKTLGFKITFEPDFDDVIVMKMIMVSK